MTLNSKFVSAIWILFAIHFSIPGFSQDTAWTSTSISPDVSIDMLGHIYQYDTLKMKIFTSKNKDYELQVKYLELRLESRNGDEVVQHYDEFVKGYLNTNIIRQFTNIVSDTSFAGTNGKWIHSTYSKNNAFEELFTYVVLANSHFYLVTFASDHPVSQTLPPGFSRYFSSLKFLSQPIQEYSGDFPLRASSFRLGQRIGRSLPYIAGIAASVLVLILVFIKITRKE